MSPNQLNIKLITKNNKNLLLHFLKVTKFVNQMTPNTKKWQICKNHEYWFYENWLFKEERPFEEKKRYEEQSLIQ